MSEIKTRQFRELPKMHTTYANVIKSLIPSRDKSVDTLPQAVFEVPNLVIDEDNLKEYRKVCGFMNDGRVPATYFAVLSQTLQMNMMASDDFPFAMLGLIHIYNKVTQYRVIYDSESVQMTVELANLQPHEKGQQFDFITKVYANDKLIWQGVSTYLSRQKVAKTGEKPKKDPISILRAGSAGLTTAIEVPEDMGRRYAFVSGDFNLIHLHPLSAKAFGYPKAIAHGMWSKAKCLALLKTLPEAFECEVTFKAPIFLPSSVEFVANKDESAWAFGLYGQKTDGQEPRVHMVGTLLPVTEVK